jgi:hypothetical protein
MSKILSSKIRHQMQFAPDPNRTAFPTKPIFVETRLIRDITHFPEGVKYVSFYDIVETEIQMSDGTTQTVYSEPFNNNDTYYVKWVDEEVQKSTFSFSQELIAVHSTVKEKVFVIPTSKEQSEKQQAA